MNNGRKGRHQCHPDKKWVQVACFPRHPLAKPLILGGTGQSVSRPLQKADGDKKSREAELYLDLLSGLNLVPKLNGKVGKMKRLLEAEVPIWGKKVSKGLTSH